MKKIVAIGGGENGRVSSSGKKYPWETEPMDREIIALTGKERPHFLLIAHSQKPEGQQGYFDVMKAIYEPLGCECRDLKSDELTDPVIVNEKVEWRDIIYEGGGDTLSMIELWKETGFDKVLRSAWEAGKVMCGVSAGANCWFTSCNSDSLKILHGEGQPLIGVPCLGFIDAYFVPHRDEEGRYDSRKDQLRDGDAVGIMCSNCTALEILDDEYRLITSDASYHGITAYGLKAYWKDGVYHEKKLPSDGRFRPLSELLKR